MLSPCNALRCNTRAQGSSPLRKPATLGLPRRARHLLQWWGQRCHRRVRSPQRCRARGHGKAFAFALGSLAQRASHRGFGTRRLPSPSPRALPPLPRGSRQRPAPSSTTFPSTPPHCSPAASVTASPTRIRFNRLSIPAPSRPTPCSTGMASPPSMQSVDADKVVLRCAKRSSAALKTALAFEEEMQTRIVEDAEIHTEAISQLFRNQHTADSGLASRVRRDAKNSFEQRCGPQLRRASHGHHSSRRTRRAPLVRVVHPVRSVRRVLSRLPEQPLWRTALLSALRSRAARRRRCCKGSRTQLDEQADCLSLLRQSRFAAQRRSMEACQIAPRRVWPQPRHSSTAALCALLPVALSELDSRRNARAPYPRHPRPPGAQRSTRPWRRGQRRRVRSTSRF